eukprot:1349135-Amorphochlora_amoeboformis.AAC.1
MSDKPAFSRRPNYPQCASPTKVVPYRVSFPPPLPSSIMFRSVMPVSRPCRLVVRSTQNFLPYFRSSPKELGEKIAFGMVDRDYLDDTLAKIESGQFYIYEKSKTPPSQFKSCLVLGSSEHLVLDIRETHETSDGSRIPYSMCVPASELESALDLSPKV